MKTNRARKLWRALVSIPMDHNNVKIEISKEFAGLLLSLRNMLRKCMKINRENQEN